MTLAHTTHWIHKVEFKHLLMSHVVHAWLSDICVLSLSILLVPVSSGTRLVWRYPPGWSLSSAGTQGGSYGHTESSDDGSSLSEGGRQRCKNQGLNHYSSSLSHNSTPSFIKPCKNKAPLGHFSQEFGKQSHYFGPAMHLILMHQFAAGVINHICQRARIFLRRDSKGCTPFTGVVRFMHFLN